MSFTPVDFEDCRQKAVCCGGENNGRIYNTFEPCTTGFEFDYDTCECIEQCSEQYDYRFTLYVRLVGAFWYLAIGDCLDGPNEIIGSIFGSNPRSNIGTISGHTFPQVIGQHGLAFGDCEESNCTVYCKRPLLGTVTMASISLASRDLCPTEENPEGTFAGGLLATATYPNASMAPSAPSFDGNWAVDVIKFEVRNPNDNLYYDLGDIERYPLPENFDFNSLTGGGIP